MTTFSPSSWRKAGTAAGEAADDLYTEAHEVIISERLTARTSSPIEAAAVAGDGLCWQPWHEIIAGAYEELTSVASKMVGTGDDYATVEDFNEEAASRFWEG